MKFPFRELPSAGGGDTTNVSVVDAGGNACVFTSSLGVLARPLRSPVTERDPVGPVLPYHVSKYWGELALRRGDRAAAAQHFDEAQEIAEELGTRPLLERCRVALRRLG